LNDLVLLPQDRAPHVLCLGAHCDDIEIGCGATLLSLIERRPDITVDWVVLTSDPPRELEAQASCNAFLAGASDAWTKVFDFETSFLPYEGAAVKREFERLKDRPRPDVVFTHARDDLHQDHRVVHQLTWNTYRDHVVLEYEIPKFDGDFGQPSVYFPVDDDVAERKVDLLHEHFASQRDKPWFNRELFRGLMRLRGMECRAESGLAEAFYGRKIRLY
jgi:LmbE family N-acetylglucosaminyl deacetylase